MRSGSRSRAAGLVLLCAMLPAQRGWGQPGTNWDRVKQVGPGTSVRVKVDGRRSTRCDVTAVDDDQLACSARQSIFFVPVTRRFVFQRAQVREVRLTNGLGSGLVGAGVGIGVGVGAGFGLENAATRAEDPNVLPVVMGLLGGLLGAVVGRATDVVGGPTIYRVP